MASLSLVTSAAAYDKSAIMRHALAQCFTFRTTATQVGPSALDLAFRIVRVFCRAKLSTALKAAWRLARRQRLDRLASLPGAIAAQQARDAATRARHAAEIHQVRAEMAALVPTLSAAPLAA